MLYFFDVVINCFKQQIVRLLGSERHTMSSGNSKQYQHIDQNFIKYFDGDGDFMVVPRSHIVAWYCNKARCSVIRSDGRNHYISATQYPKIHHELYKEASGGLCPDEK